MGILLQNTIFGKPKHKYNTFIGGLSSTINTPSLLAAKLGITSSRIQFFSISGDDIKCFINGGNYSIPINAFSGNTSITYYYDNDGLVNFIGTSAFSRCINLVGAKFKNWSATNGPNTFLGCSKLIDTDFSSLKSIMHNFTFQNCTLLSNSSFNWSALTAIANSSFYDCSGITGTIFLTMSGTLGANAFRGTNITSFIGNNITTIDYGSFTSAILLNHFEANSVLVINSVNTNAQTFQGVPCKDYNFPVLETIGVSSFKGNTYIESFTATNLKNIGVQTFNSATNLKICNIPNIEVLGTGAFGGCRELPSFPDTTFDKVLTIPASLFSTCNNPLFTRVCFNNATSCLDNPFSQTTYLTDIIAPKIKSAGMGMLQNTSNVTNLNIEEVETLGTQFLNGFGNNNFPLSVINIPKCKSFTGSPSVLKNMFIRAKPGIIINVNVAMSTINSGSPDFDLTWAITNKSAIVNYIT